MYNDNNGLSDRRRAMQRQAVSAVSDNGMSIPHVDDNSGGRRCDGSMPNSHSTKNNGQTGWGLREYPLAMVYSPYQVFRELYSPDTALSRGTLFSELDLPFEGYKKNGGC